VPGGPMNRMQGQVALVTGSTKGIGRAIAEMFAAEGAAVVVTGRSMDGVDIAEGIRARGGDAIFERADLTSESDVERLISVAVTHFGRLTVLVNNAAATDRTIPGAGDGRVGDLSNEDCSQMLLAGLTGPVFWTTKHALPHLEAAGGGAILNISSTASIRGTLGIDAYATTKGAMNALTRQVAVGYGSKGIRCNAIICGWIITGSRPRRPTYERLMKPVHLTTRFGQPTDIAYACTWLCSPEGEFVTGQTIIIDGGVTCRMPTPSLEDAAVEGRASGSD
jgi:meso-butanediol dehydrogenase/(S,S)-butanediol dehydrogenase/diacetyl reductase